MVQLGAFVLAEGRQVSSTWIRFQQPAVISAPAISLHIECKDTDLGRTLPGTILQPNRTDLRSFAGFSPRWLLSCRVVIAGDLRSCSSWDLRFTRVDDIGALVRTGWSYCWWRIDKPLGLFSAGGTSPHSICGPVLDGTPALGGPARRTSELTCRRKPLISAHLAGLRHIRYLDRRL